MVNLEYVGKAKNGNVLLQKKIKMKADNCPVADAKNIMR